MTKNIRTGPSKQSFLLTILFTILSVICWASILLFILHVPVLTLAQQKIQPIINRLRQPPASVKDSANFETPAVSYTLYPVGTPGGGESNVLNEIALKTTNQYGYPLFFYPVSKNIRLPADYPTTTSQLSLVTIGEVSVAEIISAPLTDLMMNAKKAGFSPYLRSGFRSIDDQYTAYSRYVTEATESGINLIEAREYASQFSAIPGYSEHHLGLAVDMLDYFYPDWILARNNYNKGLYLWLRQHAHEYGFVISYPPGMDQRLAKAGSGYTLSEPWHMRFVGKDLAEWLFKNDYLNPQNNLTVEGTLIKIYQMINSKQPNQ